MIFFLIIEKANEKSSSNGDISSNHISFTQLLFSSNYILGHYISIYVF